MLTDWLPLALIFLLTYALIGINSVRKENRRKWLLVENMPEELRNAKLVASEKYFSVAHPRKMHGTLDQLYRLTNKHHALVDSKTRSRHTVYKKDIVQLSVYKVILERNGFKMADYAYFRVVTPKGIKYIKELLLTEEETVAEYDNAKNVLTGKKEPLTAENKRMCKGCSQQPNCKKWQYTD
tara:strand:+ start:13242 stop:13787 length:546 start_codon:yes stop_codon:yes gene_type:complete